MCTTVYSCRFVFCIILPYSHTRCYKYSPVTLYLERLPLTYCKQFSNRGKTEFQLRPVASQVTQEGRNRFGGKYLQKADILKCIQVAVILNLLGEKIFLREPPLTPSPLATSLCHLRLTTLMSTICSVS